MSRSSHDDHELLLLLPPSEGKSMGGRGAAWVPASGAFRALSSRRAEVAAALAELGGGDTKLLGVRGDHLDRAASANATLMGAPTSPAWRRYTGVVWDHLDAASLPASARRRIVVVSGLHGLLRADDPTPDYRLKMGANLPGLGKLSTWWRPAITDEVQRVARRRFVIDLLPQEHRAAVRDVRVDGVRVDLVDPTGAPGGHFAKAAKGFLARALLTDGLAALDRWNDERFRIETHPLATP